MPWKEAEEFTLILLLIFKLAASLAKLYMLFNKSLNYLHYAKMFSCGNDARGITGSSSHL